MHQILLVSLLQGISTQMYMYFDSRMACHFDCKRVSMTGVLNLSIKAK